MHHLLSRCLPTLPLATVLLGLVACASGGRVDPPPAAPAEVAEAPGEVLAMDEEPLTIDEPWTVEDRERVPRGRELTTEPEDGRWRIDEQGRYFHVHGMPKLEGGYSYIEDGKAVRLSYGLRFELIDQDDDYFYVKIFRPLPRVERPTPDDDAATKTPATDLVEVDRVRLEKWDKGLPTRGQWRQGITAADMNGDGHVDLVLAPPRKGDPAPVIFLGNGAGTWSRWRTRFPRAVDYGDVEVGDLDDDGALDVVVASHLHGVTAFRNLGGGEFELWSEGIVYLTSAEFGREPHPTSRAIELVDWNGDGRLDILALGEGPRLALSRPTEQRSGAFAQGSRGPFVYLNEGAGKWRLVQDESSNPPFGDSLAVGHLDDDGRIDFAIGVGRGNLADLLYRQQSDGNWRAETVAGVPPGVIARQVELADFDGDGKSDLALGFQRLQGDSWWSGVDLYLRRADGWARRPALAAEGKANVIGLSAGDLDGDGKLDLVAGTSAGEIWLLLGDGEGGFSRELAPEIVAPGAGCGAYSVLLADLDGAAGDELAVGWAGEGSYAIGTPTSPCPGDGGLSAFRAAG